MTKSFVGNPPSWGNLNKATNGCHTPGTEATSDCSSAKVRTYYCLRKAWLNPALCAPAWMCSVRYALDATNDK